MKHNFDTILSYRELYRSLAAQQQNEQSSKNEAAVQRDDQEGLESCWLPYEQALPSTWTPIMDSSTHPLSAIASTERVRVQPTTKILSNLQAWDRFYEQHQTNFFKDRHYLKHAFPQEFGLDAESNTTCSTQPKRKVKRILVEAGCGVGNALLPLLENDDITQRHSDGDEIEWTVYGIDLSRNAISLLEQDTRFQRANSQGRAFAYAWDLVSSLPHPGLEGVAHVTSLLFCMSAVDPAHHLSFARHVAQTLQPGIGVLVFRDYGRFDEAQLKLHQGREKLIQDNYYRKHDDTKCYYFEIEELREIFEQVELDVLELNYIRRVYKNRGDQTQRRRVWVHGRFLRRPV